MILKIDKSPDPDAIHPKLLRRTAEQLGTALESISNLTLEKGSMLNEWREAHISAICERGSS